MIEYDSKEKELRMSCNGCPATGNAAWCPNGKPARGMDVIAALQDENPTWLIVLDGGEWCESCACERGYTAKPETHY